jgi:putative hydrolase of the HAD superfamily
MYPYIIFDADNTLFDFSRSEAEALAKTFQSVGFSQFDPKKHLRMYREVNKQIWKEFEAGDISPETLKAERFRRFLSLLEGDNDADGAEFSAGSPEEISSLYLTCLSESAVLLPGAFAIVRSLYRSRTLSLVTNGLTSVQKPRIEASGIKDYFSAVLISEEIGIAKPDPEIFALGMKKMGAEEKRSVLMVGDNLNSDIRGGNEFGIATCWFNPDSQANCTSVRPTYEISKLEELESVLLPGSPAG